MTDQTNSFIDMFKKFGSDLGLAKVDVEKLVDINRKNIEALTQSAHIYAGGAKELAVKQKEFAEGAFREAVNVVRDFKPTGNPGDIVSKQADLAKMAFEATLANTRDAAELVKQSNVDAFKIIGARIKESVVELRSSFDRGVDESEK